MTDGDQQRHGQRRWRFVGAILGIVGLVWVWFLIDLDRLLDILRNAKLYYLLPLFLSLSGEQLVRAWKWRQLLFTLRPIATLRLFGAFMAGYFANFVVPLGVSPFVRSWLIARLDNLTMSAVLATTAIDRLIDGVFFVGFVGLVVTFAVFSDPQDNMRYGLVIGGIGSLVLFPSLMLVLARHRYNMENERGLVLRLLTLLPDRAAARTRGILCAFADGIVLPRATWRRLGIVIATLVVKLIAASHLLWAGLAFGVLLNPIDYLFLMVFLGFIIVLSRIARIPGGFIVGGTFALGLLGVENTLAAAMVATVLLATNITIVSIGAVTLWRNGISLTGIKPKT